ncbi:MAG: hypothetical protein KAT70_00375, partial [Thermoplasmata archaeon]|nr:hypothetical protein [Thermoplasmata archaeon]
STTAAAVRDAVAQVAGVLSATVLVNDTDVTDADGVPPHALEAIVRGGTDSDVATAILGEKAGGIQAHGSEGPFTTTDSQGVAHQIDFTRPTVVDIYLEVDVDVGSDYAGDTALEEALVDYGDANLVEGSDVVLSKLVGEIFRTILGVTDVTEIRVGITASPTATVNHVITAREIADLDTSRILVTSAVV